MLMRPRIAFSWEGLPQYAAREIRAAIEQLHWPAVVIGTTPRVPIAGMEQALGCRILWVEGGQALSWASLGCAVPEIFVQSGWAFTAFQALGREVKRRGGKVIGLSDANWRRDFRQLVLGPLAFRLFHRQHFDAMMVPGRQGVRLMKYFGLPAARIAQGMYGADPGIFNGGLALAARPKRFLYVGQYIERKNILGLVEAFLRFAQHRPEWTLHLVGSGELRERLPRLPQILIEDFVQPERLVEYYRQARFFVLPSHVEAWGLVVHEATLCGCGLVLSDAVGSADDLATRRNAVRFASRDGAGLVQALEAAAAFDDRRLGVAEAESRALAKHFGPARFAAGISHLVAGLGAR